MQVAVERFSPEGKERILALQPIRDETSKQTKFLVFGEPKRESEWD